MSKAEDVGSPLRTLVGTTIGAFGLSLSTALVYLNMRAVMEIGGSCASGGPFEVAVPCPKGVGWMMTAGIFGWFVFAGVLLVTAGRGPQLALLAWPALFLSLGWNFLDFGFDPPEYTTTGGWIFCGVLFWLMGGLPLLGLLRWAPRATFWGTGGTGPAAGGPGGGPDGPVHGPAFSARQMLKDTQTVLGLAKAIGPHVSKSSIQTRSDTRTPPWVTTPASSPTVDGGLVDQLERLAHLKEVGDLSPTEYESAKRTLLGDG